MTSKGYKQVAFKSIMMDVADIRARSKRAHITELAANIRETLGEPIHSPTVRVPGNVLLCGRDRMAALLLLKAKKFWVRQVECSDSEARELELAENAYRRPVENRAEMIAEMVQLRTAAIKSESVVTEEQGRTVSLPAENAVKAKARKEVARAAGVSVAAVKKAEQRAKAAKEEAPAEPAAPEPATLDLLFVDDDGARAIMHLARGDQEAIDKADKLLQRAQAALNGLTANALQQQLYADVHRVASRVRSHRPEFICPWCKGLPDLLEDCQPCLSLGYVSHEIAGRAPPELRTADPPLVMIHGKAWPYADVRDGKAPPKNGHAKRGGLTVETTDGEVHDLTVEADDEQAY